MILLRKHPFRASGSFARLKKQESGVALVLVLGVIFVLLVIVAGLAAQVRTQLRSARLNTEVADAQALVASAFQHAATDVQAILNGPDPLTQLASATSDCNPVTQSWSQTLSYCVRRFPALDGVPGDPTGINIGDNTIPLTQVPVEVKFVLPQTSTPKVVDGWLLLDMNASPPTVLYIIPDYRWCRPTSGPDTCEEG